MLSMYQTETDCYMDMVMLMHVCVVTHTVCACLSVCVSVCVYVCVLLWCVLMGVVYEQPNRERFGHGGACSYLVEILKRFIY